MRDAVALRPDGRWGGRSAWGSFVALNLAALFFVLKAFTPRLLAFEVSTRSLVAIVLGVVLVHSNAIDAIEQDGVLRQELPLAGTILFAAGISCVQRAVRTFLSHLVGAVRRARPALLSVREIPGHPRDLALVGCRCAPRAPPVPSHLR